jgi:uncharacterized protein (TIGR00369 family)
MLVTAAYIDQMNANSLYHTLGIRVEDAQNGKAKARLTPRIEICWPFAGQPHGGVLFTFMDTTMAWAVLSQLDSGYNCTTVNLNIHYTLPARGKFFICSAWTQHRTGRTSFVRADIQDIDGNLVAMGQANFRIIKMDLNQLPIE